ncbi:hypothetical protein FHS61_002474 [Altererythrobacter atlanticus]|uniref:Uncharacterized protein n=1 Tax=Croceibacterium atlanticum TaxID=1267766 RepID=A0A0F7KN81_9SPHN|nr:DUF4197 domain-containing protein [Croceibacterium atlanticum]AKH41993.1 hypothetical protein WYH_00945 [Croceibacterium atlanticum]MBB5733439.1 hypothetical protein [Croceibacterium atlanticum]
MHQADHIHRRSFLIGSLAAGGSLALAGCASYGGGISFTEAIRRLLLLSSERAFARMTAPGGFWDESVATLGLNEFLGTRGDVLSGILTSALFKSRLEDAVADIAVEASYRAAPIVADTIRTIGFENAVALIRGGPTAGTSFVRQEMGVRLLDALVPEVGEALRVAEDPLMGQLLSGLAGVDVAGVARNFSQEVENVVWREIGREEAAIRADPQSTRDPLLIGALEAARAL